MKIKINLVTPHNYHLFNDLFCSKAILQVLEKALIKELLATSKSSATVEARISRITQLGTILTHVIDLLRHIKQ